jgi:dTDP-4-dehydrorhamnose 3,5-epimerase
VNLIETTLPGVLVIEPRVFADARGHFFESFNVERYASVGISAPFVQDNVSSSMRGILRGLHFQHPQSQGKLVQVLDGEVFDVAVDVRRGSPRFGRWVGQTLSSENKRQMWIPPGFAHGFFVLSQRALFGYKCTEYYEPRFERTLQWNDATVGVCWPFDAPTLSDKDAAGKMLMDFGDDELPPYGE